jgi:hypothetical protein
LDGETLQERFARLDRYFMREVIEHPYNYNYTEAEISSFKAKLESYERNKRVGSYKSYYQSDVFENCCRE